MISWAMVYDIVTCMTTYILCMMSSKQYHIWYCMLFAWYRVQTYDSDILPVCSPATIWRCILTSRASVSKVYFDISGQCLQYLPVRWWFQPLISPLIHARSMQSAHSVMYSITEHNSSFVIPQQSIYVQSMLPISKRTLLKGLQSLAHANWQLCWVTWVHTAEAYLCWMRLCSSTPEWGEIGLNICTYR